MHEPIEGASSEDAEKASMKMVSALMLYASDKKGDTCVELFDVVRNCLINPRLPMPEELERIADACKRNADSNDLCGMVGIRTIYIKNKHMVWVEPARKRKMLTGGTKDYELDVPDMVFEYRGPDHTVNVYWLFGDSVVPAELPNIDQKGRVCLGNSMVKVAYVPDIMKMQTAVVKSFWGSTFNEWRSPRVGKIITALQKPGFIKSKAFKDSLKFVKKKSIISFADA